MACVATVVARPGGRHKIVERLPEGHRVSAMDGRAAVMADQQVCGEDHYTPTRFLIRWGYGRFEGKMHPDLKNLPKLTSFRPVGSAYPDDPVEAEKVWETAEAWVRDEANGQA